MTIFPRMMRKVTSPFFVGLIIFSGAYLFHFRSLLVHLTEPLSLQHGDSYLVMFILKSTMDRILSGQWHEISSLPMFYGFEHSLFFTEHHIVQSILLLPLYVATRNIFISFYVMALGSLWVSGVAMYLFVWKLVHSWVPAVFAAIIFTVNPFIMARFPDHMLLSTGVFLIAMIYSFESVIQTGSKRHSFLIFIWATLQVIASSTHYSVFLSIIAPLYIAFRLIQTRHIRNVISVYAFAGALLLFLTVFIQWRAYAPVYSDTRGGRPIEESVVFSARPTDWLFTAPNSVIYGALKSNAASSFPSIVRLGVDSEHNLFPGIIVLIIIITGLFRVRLVEHRGIWIACIALILLSFVMSLGPDWYVYSIIYRLNPLFSLVRVPARFGMFVFLGLAIVVALFVAERIKNNTTIGSVISIVFWLFLLGEYAIKPYEFLPIDTQTRSFYENVRQSSANVVMDLPLGNRLPPGAAGSRLEDLDARYLLWAMSHGKQLLNGYSGYMPESYLNRNMSFSVRFPTTEKVEMLKNIGVDGIILHKDEWDDPRAFSDVSQGLEELGATLQTQTENLRYYQIR